MPSKKSELTWIATALGELGQKEIPGHGTNPRIKQYHAVTSLGAEQDEVPWCASFVCWCLPDQGTHSAAAKSFMRYGVYMAEPIFGCIVVTDRGQGKGHVGFYVGKRGDKILILGGNQGNEVSIREFDSSSVLAYRWPNIR